MSSSSFRIDRLADPLYHFSRSPTSPEVPSPRSDPDLSDPDSDFDMEAGSGSDLHSEVSFSYDIPDEPQPVSPPLPARDRNSLDGRTSRATNTSARPFNLPVPSTSNRGGALPRKTSANLAAGNSNHATAANAKFGTRLRMTDSPADHVGPFTGSLRTTSASRARQSAPPIGAVSGARTASATKPTNATIGKASAAVMAASNRPGARTVVPRPSASTINSTAANVGSKLGPRRAAVPKPAPGKTWI